jgi:hypothetical protein
VIGACVLAVVLTAVPAHGGVPDGVPSHLVDEGLELDLSLAEIEVRCRADTPYRLDGRRFAESGRYGRPVLVEAGLPLPAGSDRRLAVVPGRRAPVTPGRIVSFRVEVERGLAFDPDCFGREVERILWDANGWTATGRVAFRRVDGPAYDFAVVLASPQTTRDLCRPLDTGLRLSCRQGKRAVINAWRWQHGASAFEGDLHRYRSYLINHEVGHVLGYGHDRCRGEGLDAPVMMQQTKGVGECRANGLPLDRELP